jgi:hypothetical protein
MRTWGVAAIVAALVAVVPVSAQGEAKKSLCSVVPIPSFLALVKQKHAVVGHEVMEEPELDLVACYIEAYSRVKPKKSGSTKKGSSTSAYRFNAKLENEGKLVTLHVVLELPVPGIAGESWRQSFARMETEPCANSGDVGAFHGCVHPGKSRIRGTPWSVPRLLGFWQNHQEQTGAEILLEGHVPMFPTREAQLGQLIVPNLFAVPGSSFD